MREELIERPLYSEARDKAVVVRNGDLTLLEARVEYFKPESVDSHTSASGCTETVLGSIRKLHRSSRKQPLPEIDVRILAEALLSDVLLEV